MQAYNLGRLALAHGEDAAALGFFQRATQLDPNFAMAYWGMSQSYNGETTLAVEIGRKAYGLRERLSEFERLRIECDDPSGDVMKAMRSCELGAKTYPRDALFHQDLALYSDALGRYETGLKEKLEAVRLAPYDGHFCRTVIYAYLLLNRVQEAEAAAKEACAKAVDANSETILYLVAFYRDDHAEMARQAARAVGVPGDEDSMLSVEADTAAYFGHLGKARELTRRAAESAELAAEKETAATYYATSALREALFGNVERARQQATLAKRRASGRDVDYGLALALAYAGDANRARVLADGLGRRFPEDTTLQLTYLPTLRAKLALVRSNPQQAVDILRVAAPYELGLSALSGYNWPSLYPVYVRGEAYLAAHQGKEAAAEFQRILDHRGIVLNEPIGALAHLQLGRAYSLQGDTAKARAAYQDFLTLWKDADPDIPVFKEAKAEYAKLQ